MSPTFGSLGNSTVKLGTLSFNSPHWHSRRRGYCVQSRLFVYLIVRALTGKRLELSTPNLVHVYYIAVARHAWTQRSKGKGQGHTVTKTKMTTRNTPVPRNLYILPTIPPSSSLSGAAAVVVMRGVNEYSVHVFM